MKPYITLIIAYFFAIAPACKQREESAKLQSAVDTSYKKSYWYEDLAKDPKRKGMLSEFDKQIAQLTKQTESLNEDFVYMSLDLDDNIFYHGKIQPEPREDRDLYFKFHKLSAFAYRAQVFQLDETTLEVVYGQFKETNLREKRGGTSLKISLSGDEEAVKKNISDAILKLRSFSSQLNRLENQRIQEERDFLNGSKGPGTFGALSATTMITGLLMMFASAFMFAAKFLLKRWLPAKRFLLLGAGLLVIGVLLSLTTYRKMSADIARKRLLDDSTPTIEAFQALTE